MNASGALGAVAETLATAPDEGSLAAAAATRLLAESRHFQHYNETAAFGVSVVMNLTLIWLLITEKNETLCMYTRVLLQNCVIDMLYTCFMFICELQVELTQGHMVFTINSRLKAAPMAIQYTLMFFYSVFCALAIDVVPIVFFYRYMLVCRGKVLGRNALNCILGVVLLFVLTESAFLVGAQLANEPVREELCLKYLNHLIWWEPGTRRPTTKCLVSALTHYSFGCFLAIAIFLDCAIYTVITFCTFSILKHMRGNNRIFSERTTRMNKQMNRLLLAQMIVPMITAIIPAVVLLSFPILDVDAPGVGMIVTVLFTWIPVISPTTTICLVTNFRNRLIRNVSGSMIQFCQRQYDKSGHGMTANTGSSAQPTESRSATQTDRHRPSLAQIIE